jgi:hypothetical protein
MSAGMLLSLVILLACPWVDESDRAAAADRDGDGVSSVAFGGTDCDDADAAVGAPALTVYADADGDGLGDAATAALACAAGEGVVTDATDCDDGDASVGAPTMRWPDADGDGHGDATAAGALACTGGAAEAGDCDDVDASVHPGAWESCVGEVDANCDGAVGGDWCSTAGLGPWATATPEGVGYGSAFGERLAGGVDIDGDGTLDVVVGAPYAFTSLAFSGADLLAGRDLDESDAILEFAEFQAGNGVSFSVGDATGDGVADLLVGCPGEPDDTQLLGADVAVVELPTDGQVRASDARITGATASGWFGYTQAYNPDNEGVATLLVGAPQSNDFTGGAWAVEMPLPGGGEYVVTDLPQAALGGMPSQGAGFGVGWEVAWLENEGGDIAVVADQAAVVQRKVTGAVVLWQPELGAGETAVTFGEGTGVYGVHDYESFGYSVAVGDYNGDGVEDLAVGAIHSYRDDADVGAVYLFHSAAELEGWIPETSADQAILGESGPDVPGAEYPLFGARVVFPGDMNGDGLGDLAASAPFVTGLGGEIGAGAVYVVPGGLSGRDLRVEEVAWVRYGADPRITFGAGLTPAGDVDEDGRADLAVGALDWPAGNGTQIGAVALWLGGQL